MIKYSETVLKSTEGGTLALDGSELPSRGYFVGGLVSPLIYDALCDSEDIDLFAEYVDHSTAAQYLGWWTDTETGLLWVDGTEHYLDREAAAIIGRARGEIAVYDIENGAEIRL